MNGLRFRRLSKAGRGVVGADLPRRPMSAFWREATVRSRPIADIKAIWL